MKVLLTVLIVGSFAACGFAQDTATNTAAAAATSSMSQNTIMISLDAGTITPPLVLTNGILGQPDTTDLAGGGKATYSFTITNEGDYVVVAQINAPGEDSNSFFVNIDAPPEDPKMVWDMDVTSGFEERTVSWRGNGDANQDEIVPKKFHLTAGEHKLFLVGREPTQLKSLSLKMQ